MVVKGQSTQGPLSPGTTVDDATVGNTAWATPNNSQSSNDSYATFTTFSRGGTSHYLKATNYGFTIPAGATINGILVETEAKRTSSVPTTDLRIVKNGSISSTLKQISISTTEAYISCPASGASSDLWGETWTVSDINASGFGVVIGNIINPISGTTSIDHIRITVYYTPSASKPYLQVFQ